MDKGGRGVLRRNCSVVCDCDLCPTRSDKGVRQDGVSDAVVAKCVSAFHTTTSQSSTTDGRASLIPDVDNTALQPQSTDEYETHTDTATVAMETPSSTTHQLVQHSTTSVDISTMPAYFTTGRLSRYSVVCSEFTQLRSVSEV